VQYTRAQTLSPRASMRASRSSVPQLTAPPAARRTATDLPPLPPAAAPAAARSASRIERPGASASVSGVDAAAAVAAAAVVAGGGGPSSLLDDDFGDFSSFAGAGAAGERASLGRDPFSDPFGALDAIAAAPDPFDACAAAAGAGANFSGALTAAASHVHTFLAHSSAPTHRLVTHRLTRPCRHAAARRAALRRVLL